MIREIVKYTLISIALIIVQVFVLNKLPLNHNLRPQIYIYLLIILPFNFNFYAFIISGFLLGICLDTLTDNYGIIAASTTFLGLIRFYFDKRLNTDAAMREGRYRPSSLIFGRSGYILYLFAMALVHHLYMFSLEYYSFSYFFTILFTSLLSAVGTILFIILTEIIFNKGKF